MAKKSAKKTTSKSSARKSSAKKTAAPKKRAAAKKKPQAAAKVKTAAQKKAKPAARKTSAAARSTSAAEETAKLTLRVGGGEIHLEAGRAVVREELDRALDRLLEAAASTGGGPLTVSVSSGATTEAAAPARPAAAPGEEPSEAALRHVTRERGQRAVDPGAVKLLRRVTLAPERFADLYSVDRRGGVALRRTPSRPLDAMFLLLYGALTLSGRSPLSAPALLKAARASGLSLERVPRKLSNDKTLVHATGQRRGRRYSLAPAGVARAETLVRGLLDTLPSPARSPSPASRRRDDDWAPW